jgi:very-long-chain enoyl-CoA reductase
MSYIVTVKDRKENTLCTFKDPVAAKMSVQDFKVLFVKECEMARKRHLDPNRCYFRVTDSTKGLAMTDRGAPVSKFFGENAKEVTIYFKDIGPQVSWTTVFLVEYFGPMFIAIVLAVFREQIYGKAYELTLNQ